ncbi:MAG: SAM-dependent methyltransferase, partial [Flavobacteriaceae bacterium]|nr:SAM-dependent methyltransferase [Flavobacteriaceae bacterium]
MGGGPAALYLLQAMAPVESDSVLDVGCGIGGTTRALAANFQVASIDGVDLTPEYVDMGNEINTWPAVKAAFRGGVGPKLVQGSALALPYPDESFTKITMLHVGMNIEDKAALFREFGRVLRPGGAVGVYDVMRLADGELPFPMPWSSAPETSFVRTPDAYKEALGAAGLALEREDNRREATMEMLQQQLAAAAQGSAQE